VSILRDPGKRNALPDIFRDGGNERCHTLATRNWDSRRAHKSSTIPNGTFAWMQDPEGNTVGLWKNKP